MIDPAKTYRTRDGREVRIYAVDGAELDGVHGAILFPERGWLACQWHSDGKYISNDQCSADLIEVKPKHVRWVNVYSHGDWSDYEDRESADRFATSTRIACIRIEFEEGEGL